MGLSGALICQYQKYGDVNMGTGAIVIGLAAIVIGRGADGTAALLLQQAHLRGGRSMIYFLIRAWVLQMGMNPTT